VRARNSEGYGEDSNEVSILAAERPTKPGNPTVTFQPDFIAINWVPPFAGLIVDGGSPLLGYRVFIEKHDGTFGQELTQCDGSDATIMTNYECTIDISLLKAAPFLLQWGVMPKAKL
jgi:hypothetical protein